MATSPRGADARARLLRAAIDAFGRYGFAGATTRVIARSAGLNVQAITYHFGGKEGLYLAAADHIGERMRAKLGPAGARVRARLAVRGRAPISAEEARGLLAELLSGVMGILFDEAWTPFARFIVREQMDPTEAFDRLYDRIMGPQLEVARQIVGIVLGAAPHTPRVRLRTLSLVGSIMFIRIARATVARQLGWKRAGARELAAMRELVRETAQSVARAARRTA